MAEPDISGAGQRATPIASGFEFKVPGLDKTATQLAAVTNELNSLKNALQGMSSQQGQLLQGVNGIFSQVQAGANSTASALNGGGGRGGSTSTGIPFNFSSPNAGGASPFDSMTQSLAADSNLGAMMAAALMAPAKYAYGRFEESRANAPVIASALGSTATLNGTTIVDLIQRLQEGTPVKGDLSNMLGALNQGSMIGYGNLNTPRSGAYFEGIRQMQSFTPGVGASQLASMQNDWLGNTQSHQRSLMLTGGAMSGFGSGAIPKTLQEWAESTLKWFEGQRPGAQRGKKFTKEELVTQQFPGSNMDAWFSATGVPEYMRQYFWQYVIGAAQTGSNDFATIMEARGPDLAMSRLRTQTEQGRREFQMLGSGTNYEDFNTREGADRRFGSALGQLDKLLGGMMGPAFGGIIERLPTPIANLAATANFSLAGNAVSSLTSLFLGGGGKVGDPGWGPTGSRKKRTYIGDTYGGYGGTTTAHMDPSFANRIEAMMAANPRLQITSGFRDGALQGRLHAAGVGMVAPAGQSMHGRGLAADLGPESEFGWIMANAGRFGLESGANHDEPWHVGMPGTVPVGDPFSDALGIAKDVAGGVAGFFQDPVGSVAGAVPGMESLMSVAGTLMDVFQGIKGALSGDFSSLFGGGGLFDVGNMLDKGVDGFSKVTGLPLNKLMDGDAKGLVESLLGWLGGSKGARKSPIKSSVDWSQTAGGGGGATADGGLNLGMGLGGAIGNASIERILQKYGGTQVGAANVTNKKEEILKTLRAAAAAGFSGDELIAITAIAGRESGWNALTHRTTSAKSLVKGDRGLWQINGSNDPTLAKRGIISSDSPGGRSELFNPLVNARAAYLLAGAGGSGIDHNWGAGPGGWKGASGQALYNASQYVSPVYQIAKQAGMVGDPRRKAVGDVTSMAGYSPQVVSITNPSMPSTNIKSAPVTMHNTFQLQVAGNEADARRVASVIADHLQSVMSDNDYLDS